MGEFFPDDYKLKFNQFDYLDLKEKLRFFEDTAQLKEISENLHIFINKILSKKSLKDSFDKLLP